MAGKGPTLNSRLLPGIILLVKLERNISKANESAKKLTDNNFLLKRKTNFTGQTAESFSCLGRNSDANINARPGKDQVDHSKKPSQLGKKPSIDLIDTGKHNNIGRIRNPNYKKKM